MERGDFHFATKLTGKQKTNKQTNSYTKQKKNENMKNETEENINDNNKIN